MSRAIHRLDADRRRSILAALVHGVGWARIFGRPFVVLVDARHRAVPGTAADAAGVA